MAVRFKSVLVSYLERIKVFKIPSAKTDNDVPYLSGEFKKEFSLECSEVTFQIFDDEWGLPVDLDPKEYINDKLLLLLLIYHFHLVVQPLGPGIWIW